MDYTVHGVTKSQTQLSDFHFHFDFSLSFIIPGHKLISSSVCTQKFSSGFSLTFTMLFVSPCESQDFLDPGGLARLPGPPKFQDALPFLSKVPPDLLYLQAGPEFRQWPGRSEAGQRPALLLLKPEQDSLHFSSPNIKLKQLWELSIWPKQYLCQKKTKAKRKEQIFPETRSSWDCHLWPFDYLAICMFPVQIYLQAFRCGFAKLRSYMLLCNLLSFSYYDIYEHTSVSVFLNFVSV